VDFGALEKSLSALGLRHLRRIVDGWQSLAVYEAIVDGRPVAVKVVDPVLVDRAALEVRLTALTRLAAADGRVCGPVPLRGRLVNEIDQEIGTDNGHRPGSGAMSGNGLGDGPGDGLGDALSDGLDDRDADGEPGHDLGHDPGLGLGLGEPGYDVGQGENGNGLRRAGGAHVQRAAEGDPVGAGGRAVFAPVDGERRRRLVTVAYDFAEGEAPENDRPEVASRMGRSLAELHRAMAALPTYPLPGLAAFPPLERIEKVAEDLGVPVHWLADALPEHQAGPPQLLHGDFSSKNMRVTGAGWRIFDFDDCGYGPVELDLANSVYFVLFDATLRHDLDRYHRFRASFVEGYHAATGWAPTDGRIDALLTRRVLTLASWLADPTTAPSGIRTASAEWLATLHDFVRRYLGTYEASGALG
jgi:Ser/Thr protein kinase RdoA (MazF antagonist)